MGGGPSADNSMPTSPEKRRDAKSSGDSHATNSHGQLVYHEFHLEYAEHRRTSRSTPAISKLVAGEQTNEKERYAARTNQKLCVHRGVHAESMRHGWRWGWWQRWWSPSPTTEGPEEVIIVSNYFFEHEYSIRKAYAHRSTSMRHVGPTTNYIFDHAP